MHVPTRPEPRENVSELAGEIAKDATRLLKDEVRLLKMSVRESSARVMKSLALWTLASLGSVLGSAWLGFALAGGLTALGLAPWASQLAVALFFLAISAIAVRHTQLKLPPDQ